MNEGESECNEPGGVGMRQVCSSLTPSPLQGYTSLHEEESNMFRVPLRVVGIYSHEKERIDYFHFSQMKSTTCELA